MDDEELERRYQRHSRAVTWLFAALLLLNVVLPGLPLAKFARVTTDIGRHSESLALATVGVMMLYLGLFTPRGWVAYCNERQSLRTGRNFDGWPEWGLPGRLLVLAVGAWLTWWLGGESLAWLRSLW